MIAQHHVKLRRGVFETNSSSTHSISIAGGVGTLDTLSVAPDGTCHIYPGEFGWDEETFRDAAIKASYALTWAMSCEDYKVGNKEESLTLLRQVIEEATGCKRVEFVKEDSEWYPHGYIDHQSIEDDGGPGKNAFASKEALRAFIFNPASFVRTDNDNH